DAAARPLRGADQVGAREQPEALAQRGATDAELGSELLLGSEALARPQVACGEVAADLEGDLLAGVPARRAEARGHGAKVASGATATSSSRGSPRSASPGSTSSS